MGAPETAEEEAEPAAGQVPAVQAGEEPEPEAAKALAPRAGQEPDKDLAPKASQEPDQDLAEKERAADGGLAKLKLPTLEMPARRKAFASSESLAAAGWFASQPLIRDSMTTVEHELDGIMP